MPVELLIKIYSSLMVLDISMYTLNRPPTMAIRSNEESLFTPTARYNASSQILRLCKLVNQVALPILYGQNTFEADGPFYISRMRDAHGSVAVSCIKKLVLHHDIASYYTDARFLGQIRRTGLPSFVFQPLSTLTNLRELNIRVHDTAEGSQHVLQCETALKDILGGSGNSFVASCMQSLSASCLKIGIRLSYNVHIEDLRIPQNRSRLPSETVAVIDLRKREIHEDLDQIWQLADEFKDHIEILQRQLEPTGTPSDSWKVVKRVFVCDMHVINDDPSLEHHGKDEPDDGNLEWYQKALDYYTSLNAG
jgi:hypothetical protein